MHLEPPSSSLKLRLRGSAGVLAAGATAVLVWFGNGLDPWWPLMWFAPLPVLLFAVGSRSWWGTGIVGFCAWLAGSFCMWRYFQTLHQPPAVWFLIYGSTSLVFTGAVLLFRALWWRGAPWSALFVFPAAWVCCEFAVSRLTPGGTAGSLAYTQLDFLPFLQLASLTGPTGPSFVLFLFSATLALGWHLRQREPARAKRILSAGVGVALLALGFGTVRLAGTVDAPMVKVGLLATDAPGTVFPPDDDAGSERLLRAYAGEAEQLAARGAQVVVLPEKLAVVAEPAVLADRIFQPVADRTGTTLIVGLIHIAGPDRRSNQARIYTPGAPVQSYDKHHLLPPFESTMQPGTTLTLLPKSAAPWGVSICKDLDFTGTSRRYGRAGTGLLLVPAWDFGIDRWWHGHIAVMRGVEDGFSVVRAAKQGDLTMSDDRGRILAQVRSDSVPFATLLAEVPVEHHPTIYARFGDWFAWLCVAGLFGAIMRLCWRSGIEPGTGRPTLEV